MSYITIPKRISSIKSISKLTDVYVWATIRLCSNFKSGKSQVTIDKLSKLTTLSESTIKRSIKRLKEEGMLEVTCHYDGVIKHNTYYTNHRKHNFFMVDTQFFHQGYSYKIAGFLLLMKSICYNDTENIGWNIQRIASVLSMPRNTISKYIAECISLGLMTKGDRCYKITVPFFINSVLNDYQHEAYVEICKFCEANGAEIPVANNRDALTIIAVYRNARPFATYQDWFASCIAKPRKKMTLLYFVYALGLIQQYNELLRCKANLKREGFEGFAFV